MVNLPGLAASRDLAREVPGLGLGLHVNLTLGAPVLPAHAVPSLVDASGRFVRDRERVGEVGVPSELRDETAAQAKRFEAAFGHRPTHVDTHYHMHRLPRILAAVLEVATDLGLPVRAVTPEMAIQIRRSGLPAVDRMVGDVGPDAYWTPESLVTFIETTQEGVTELMCHPGYADEALSINYPISLSTFQKLLAQYPNSQKAPDALLKVGYCEYEMKQWDQAESTLNQVVQKYPDTTVARLAQGRLRALKLEGRH